MVKRRLCSRSRRPPRVRRLSDHSVAADGRLRKDFRCEPPQLRREARLSGVEWEECLRSRLEVRLLGKAGGFEK